jgi:hypothetical protein
MVTTLGDLRESGNLPLIVYGIRKGELAAKRRQICNLVKNLPLRSKCCG